jgi:hypothetical protein
VRLGLRLREREVELSETAAELDVRETERFRSAIGDAESERVAKENGDLRERVEELEARLERERERGKERCEALEEQLERAMRAVDEASQRA